MTASIPVKRLRTGSLPLESVFSLHHTCSMGLEAGPAKNLFLKCCKIQESPVPPFISP